MEDKFKYYFDEVSNEDFNKIRTSKSFHWLYAFFCLLSLITYTFNEYSIVEPLLEKKWLEIIFFYTAWITFSVGFILTILKSNDEYIKNIIVVFTLLLIFSFLSFELETYLNNIILVINLAVAFLFTHKFSLIISENFKLGVNKYMALVYSFSSCLFLYAYVGNSKYFSFSKALIQEYAIVETLIEIKNIIAIILILTIVLSAIFTALKTSEPSYEKWKIEFSFFTDHLPKALISIILAIMKLTVTAIAPLTMIYILFVALFLLRRIRFFIQQYILEVDYGVSIKLFIGLLLVILFLILLILIVKSITLLFKPDPEQRNIREIKFNHLPIAIIILLLTLAVSGLTSESLLQVSFKPHTYVCCGFVIIGFIRYTIKYIKK